MDLLLIHCKEEAGQWTDYMKSMFLEFRENIAIEVVDAETDLSQVASLCSKARVIALVVSPSMLDLLEAEVDMLKHCLDSSCVTAVELFLQPGEFNSQISCEYSIKKWKNATFGEDENNNNKVVKDIIAKIDHPASSVSSPSVTSSPIDFKKELASKLGLKQPVMGKEPVKIVQKTASFEADTDIADDASEVETTSPPGGATRKTSLEESPQQQSKQDSILQDICPDCIRKANERVVLVFRREIQESQLVQVKIEDKMYDTRRCNPYCYSFKAPAHKAGYVDVYVFINGQKKCKRRVRYLTVSDIAYTCPQYIMELLGLDNLEALDEHLTSLFKASVPCDETFTHIFTPKNLATTSGQHSSDKLPTLLHFACFYGLQQLCMHIIDLPGAYYALQVQNNEDKTPVDLATEAEHEEIVQYVETFLEMQSYMLDCEEIYEKMTGIQLTSTPGYMDMGGEGGAAAHDGYLYGRMLHSKGHPEVIYERTDPQDDYEFAQAQFGGVEEVAPEEDIKQEDIEDCVDKSAPVRPPKPAERRLPPVTEEPAPKPPEAAAPVAPARPPKRTGPTGVTDPFQEILPPDKVSMGSQALDELRELQDSYKHGELSLTDIETLFRAWQLRNNKSSNSMKTRQLMLNDMKQQHIKTIEKATKNKPSMIKRLTRGSKKPDPASALKIQHVVSMPNSYESLPQRKATWATSNRDSTSSTGSRSSISSSSSGGSRHSQFEEDETPVPPPRPDHTLSRNSRLPVPPRPYIGTRTSTPLSSSPAPKVPPRRY